ncbi:MAG: nucleotidyltransferase domain-containing protein [Candidatus Woesearchaeota archaeon]
MSKKSKKKDNISKKNKEVQTLPQMASTLQVPAGAPMMPPSAKLLPQMAPPQLDPNNLPEDMQKKLKKVKEQLDKLSKKVVDKFDKYILGVSLLPPPKPKPGEKFDKDLLDVLVLVDDTDSKKMSKYDLKNKLITIIDNIAKDIDKNILPQIILLSELWQNLYDAKYELVQIIAMGATIYDQGMLQAIKIAEIHKSMVLRKFEKYIVSYVLAGSLVQGKATKTSDIDVWIVIDDTDVKKMTRAELKDKLRAIIIGMGIEAGDICGVKNKLNVQCWILTEYWDALKEANPVMFTLLRDGVPFYDRGIFMAWKQLLRMGKIKPSPEAIDLFMSSGEQMLQRVHATLKNIGMEDTFYAILTPSQAALMLYGLPPPTPKETPQLMREVFVKKEGLMEEKYIKILEKNINVRKEIEHGTKKGITGKEVDELLKSAEDYLKRIKRLFTQIEKIKEEQDVVHIYDTVITIIRDVLRMEGKEKVTDIEIVNTFEDEMISQGKIPAKYLRILNEINKAKKDYDDKKLSKTEVEQVKKNSREFIKFLVEYMQRKRGRELERAKIRVKHGNRYGEVLLLGDEAYIIHDIDHEEKEISKAKIKPDGSLGTTQKSNLEELEKALVKLEIVPKVFIKQPIFEDLKNIFGKDVEVLLNYH